MKENQHGNSIDAYKHVVEAYQDVRLLFCFWDKNEVLFLQTPTTPRKAAVIPQNGGDVFSEVLYVKLYRRKYSETTDSV